VIDADYRGPVKALLFNLCADEFKVEAGDRIAQLIVERVRYYHHHEIRDVADIIQIYTPEVLVVDQLEETVRGQGGFGSTGGFGGTLPSINPTLNGAPGS
jgi:dUTP pyrophosphatase